MSRVQQMQSMTGNNAVKIEVKRLHLLHRVESGGRLFSVYAQEFGFQLVHLHFSFHKFLQKRVVS